MKIPEWATKLVGTNEVMRGHLFSYKTEIKDTRFDILDVRWGRARVMDLSKMESYENPTVEFLVKNDTMSKSRWTRGFPVREINLKDSEED